MAKYVLRVGSHTTQGHRSNNEDRFVVDRERNVYLVADGMGGQEFGEQASDMAANIIPRAVHDRLNANDSATTALQQALSQANQAIVDAGRSQPEGRRMGTTAVLALAREDQVYVTWFGDSRAYLVRGDQIEQLTVDHSVAQALVASSAMSAEEARSSPWQNVLHKFLGSPELSDGAEVRSFSPRGGDRLILASDGLTNYINEDDLRRGAGQFPDPQIWSEQLVSMAMERGTKDNVTCVILAFDPE